MSVAIPVVVNRYHTFNGHSNDLSIMRPGPWGNPYQIGRDGTRAEVIRKHLNDWRYKLRRNPHALDPLLGKRLICCCKPAACHGDNYVLLLRELYVR